MNQFRSDSRKLRPTEDTVTASVRDSAITAVVTPVRPGDRVRQHPVDRSRRGGLAGRALEHRAKVSMTLTLIMPRAAIDAPPLAIPPTMRAKG